MKKLTVLILILAATVFAAQMDKDGEVMLASPYEANHAVVKAASPNGFDIGAKLSTEVIRDIWTGSDFDQDGNKEILLASYGVGGKAYVYEIDGNNSATLFFETPDHGASYTTACRDVKFADLDGNGMQELLVSINSSDAVGGLYIYEYDTVGDSMRAPVHLFSDLAAANRWYVENMFIEDVDGDGVQEFMVGNNGSVNDYDEYLIYSVTSGTFAGGDYVWTEEFRHERTDASFPIGGSPYGPVVADMDGDGNKEILFAAWDHGAMLIVEADAADTYTVQNYIQTDLDRRDDFAFYNFAPADLDGDGRDEVYLSMYSGGALYCITCPVDTDLSAMTTANVHKIYDLGKSGGVCTQIGDWDNNGKMNIYASGGGSVITVHEYQGGDPTNTANWTALPSISHPSFSGVYGLHYTDDLDGDGYPELYGANTGAVTTAAVAVEFLPVVINEVGEPYTMTNTYNDSYIELYNLTDAAVDVGGWVVWSVDASAKATSSIEIPAGVNIAANGYLIVTRDRTKFLEDYGSYVDGVIVVDATVTTGSAVYIKDNYYFELKNADGITIDKTSESVAWNSQVWEKTDPLADGEDADSWYLTYQTSPVEGTPGQANSTAPPATDYTIAEIQDTTSTGSADSPKAGEMVRTTGIVTGVFSGKYTIQDGNGGFSGIWVNDDLVVTVGDEVTVKGIVSESSGLTVITADSSGINSSKNLVPAAEVLPTGDISVEQWEGVLVTTVGVCDNADLGYGEWSVDDGSGPVRMDDLAYAFTPTAGTEYEITGPLYYSYGDFKITPRDADDVAVYVPPSNDLNLTFEDDSDVANWGVYDGTSGWTTVSHNATGGVDGTGAIEFGDGGYGFYIKRPISGTVGTDFQLTIDVKTSGWDDATTYPITVSVEGLGDTPVSANINGLADFTTITLTGTITNADGYIVIAGSNTALANNVWIDNLVFDDDYQPPVNYDLNLTFEDDSDVANWGVYDGTSGWTTVSHNATGGVDGTGAIEFGDGGYGFYIKRPINGTVSTQYNFSVDVKTSGWDDATNYPITIAIEGLGDTPVAANINALADFTTITLTGIITNADGYIVIAGSNTALANNVWIDNLVFDDAADIPDTDPPTIVMAEALNDTTVLVEFSEDIDVTTGETLANYIIDHEIGNPTAATVFENTVTLVVDTLDSDTLYTMIVNNVEDLSGNIIATGTEIDFMWEVWTPGPDLMITEYIEGSGNNKALELYNPTDADIDLSEYALITGNSGGGYWYDPAPLSGILPAGDTYVIIHPEFDFTLIDSAAVVDSIWGQYATYFNGDDPRAIGKLLSGEWSAETPDFVIIDAIGDIDGDPGTAWDVAGVSEATANHTLIRRAEFTMGNPDWSISAGTDEASSEWVVMPQDFCAFLGSHPHDDYAGPEIVQVSVTSETTIEVFFSEPIDSISGVELANYSIDGGIGNPTAIAVFGHAAVLTVPALAYDVPYTLTVSNVTDLIGLTILPDTQAPFVFRMPLFRPDDQIISNFENGMGDWKTPTWSGSTSGVLTTSSFTTSADFAINGTKSGKMVLLDDPAVSGGWFIRNGNRVATLAPDSKLIMYLRGSGAPVQVRFVIWDNGAGGDGYEAGPWHNVTLAEDDWQAIELDLANDPVEGWITGNGAINSTDKVTIESIQLKCTEDVDVTLYFDYIVERPNNAPPEPFTMIQPTDGYTITNDDIVQDSLIQVIWTEALDPDDDAITYELFILDATADTTVAAFFDFADTSNFISAPSYEDNGDYKIFALAFDPYGAFSSSDTINVTIDMVNPDGIDGEIGLPKTFALHQNYPNPFNPITTIKYDLPQESHVKIMIYDIMGREVRTLVNARQQAGYQAIQWNALDNNGRRVSSGYYIYVMQADKYHKTQKMILLK